MLTQWCAGLDKDAYLWRTSALRPLQDDLLHYVVVSRLDVRCARAGRINPSSLEAAPRKSASQAYDEAVCSLRSLRAYADGQWRVGKRARTGRTKTFGTKNQSRLLGFRTCFWFGAPIYGLTCNLQSGDTAQKSPSPRMPQEASAD